MSLPFAQKEGPLEHILKNSILPQKTLTIPVYTYNNYNTVLKD